ncbi:MAG: diaminopimelate epimerase [Bacteroidetes bacterium 4572_112]|nr:MAG: diaminopimelate epimerase [Bacteroidetes bacterium 4572_112]
MQIQFSKYHGAGNDFILVDNRNQEYTLDQELIAKLCERRYGIGADGLMILENSESYDFNMRYYNSDGNEGSMCGNGGRCIVAFAKDLEIIANITEFTAVDGLHKAKINSSGINTYDISLNMNDVSNIKEEDNIFFLDTGSPHHIEFVDDISKVDVYNKGKQIRYSDKYKANNGTNVNFIEATASVLKIRTYERGVEDETHACGTGATAAAIAFALKNKEYNKEVILEALGGILRLNFDFNNNIFTNIVLSGPTKLVFKGKY